MSSSQELQGVPRELGQLQELVDRHLYHPLHPSGPLRLGHQPQPGLDLLLHGSPHLKQRFPHRPLYHLGESFLSRYQLLNS